MTAQHPADWNISEAAVELRAGHVSCTELTCACLQRISERDPHFGAWIRVYEERARAAARAAETTLAAGGAGPLVGIPIGLKDVIGAVGLPLTADSAVLEGNVADVDATAWSRLERAGMVLLGHLHCGEFANGAWGANPWGPAISPGGSSSGSGIALAARTVPATLGSDGRGSIRMPAAFGNVTAIKPTFGLVSTAGCIPITFTYDVIGPLGRSATDCALLLTEMAGPDPADRATLSQPPDRAYPTAPRRGERPALGVRVGIPTFTEDMSSGIGAIYERFQRELTDLGCELVSFAWPDNPLEHPTGSRPGTWVDILGAEASVIHAQFQGREELYRREFRELLAPMSAFGTAADYVHAQVKRAEYVRAWYALFATHELTVVAHPAALDEAFGPDVVELTRKPPRLLFGAWSDANFPVVSVPAGVSPTDGSPVGMQVIGLPFTEAVLLQLAIDYQAATDHHLQEPGDLHTTEPFAGPERCETGATQPAFQPLPSTLASTTFLR